MGGIPYCSRRDTFMFAVGNTLRFTLRGIPYGSPYGGYLIVCRRQYLYGSSYIQIDKKP